MPKRATKVKAEAVTPEQPPDNTCTFCKKTFLTERGVMLHSCEKKRRWLWKDEKYAVIGFRAFQRFYEISLRSKKPKSVAREPVNGATIEAELNPDDIRCRAYEIYRCRNGGPGDHLSDWTQAERELRASCDGLAEDRDGVDAVAEGAEPTIRGDTRQHGHGAPPERGATRGEPGSP